MCRAKGCSACNQTGYIGRTVIGEIMIVSDEIREMISEGVSLSKVKEIALINGMVPMKIAGIRKINEKATSIEEIIRVVQ